MINVHDKTNIQEKMLAHKKWLETDGSEGERFVCAIGANLRDANLICADLRDANLIGANLIGANLIGANLIDADLSDANLRGANLIDADLIGANLIGANLIGANLRGADLSDANLRGANLIGANLRDAKLRDANLPTYQKWMVSWEANDETFVKIGCKTQTIAEWDAWFAGDEEYAIPRKTPDFERIEAAYQHAKRMYEISKKYGEF